MKYSIIVPVFNRPDEVDELLSSLLNQTFTDFEVLIVEDAHRNRATRFATNMPTDLICTYFMKLIRGRDKAATMVLNVQRASTCSFSTLT